MSAARFQYIRKNGGKLAGVLTADFELHALSRFLAKIHLGRDGLCFLVEIASDGSRRVIGHPAAVASDSSRRVELTHAAREGNGRETISADKVSDPRVGSALAALGGKSVGQSLVLRDVMVDELGAEYIGGFLHVGRESGPNWLICTLLPEAEVFGDVRRMAKVMVVMGLSGLIIAGALSLLLSHRVSVNLASIARETSEIGRFKLTKKPPIASRIKEISILANAMEEMKTSLRSFSKYVPTELLRDLLNSGEEAMLGGARKELTIYFSDIVGFTSISEQLPPKELSKQLSQYLEGMADGVLNNGGTVDKYIGDSIMAFWGAPRPRESHAKDACRAALANQSKLAQLRKSWQKAGLPLLRARIGLHTGNAMVGNFGCPNRLDYTAIGDSVNIASRLEGLNRIYGTEILISKATQKAVADEFMTRPLGMASVKGREQGMLIYELVCAKDCVDEKASKWIEMYSVGLDRYFRQDWANAIEAFDSVMSAKPGDRPSELMIGRCRYYQQNPPAADWNGVIIAPE